MSNVSADEWLERLGAMESEQTQAVDSMAPAHALDADLGDELRAFDDAEQDALVARLAVSLEQPRVRAPRRLVPRRTAALVACGAIAAGVAMYAFTDGASESSLPTYAMHAPNPDARFRSAPAESPQGTPRRLTLGRTLEFIFRAETRNEFAADVWVFDRSRPADALPDTVVTRADGGSLVVQLDTTTAGALRPGMAELVFMIGAARSPAPSASQVRGVADSMAYRRYTLAVHWVAAEADPAAPATAPPRPTGPGQMPPSHD